MREHGANAYLANTGWSGGGYGVGERMSLKITRRIIDAIFDGTLDNAEYSSFPIFGFEIPTAISGIDDKLLNPRNTWVNKEQYDENLRKLAEMFIKNFDKYTDNDAGKI